MLLINFIGAPGAGKTTLAAGVYHNLKTKNWNVELITEYTKELILTSDFWSLSDELLVFTEKYKRIKKMENVDLVITDSPLLNSVIYGEEKYGKVGQDFFKTVAGTFDSLYYNVVRVKPYVPIGRMPDENLAKEAGTKLLNILDSENIDFSSVYGSDTSIETVVNDIETSAYFRGYSKLTDQDLTPTNTPSVSGLGKI